MEQAFGAAASRIDSGFVSHFQDGRTLLRLLNDRLVTRNGIELAGSPPGGQRQ
jgi:hypothetical protein